MKVYQAINAVQSDLAKEGIGKGRTNTFDNYKFRGIDDVYNALSPLLAKHGLCILPRVLSRQCDERQGKEGKALFYVTVEAEFDFVCAEDGSKHVVKTYGEAMDRGDKATNKAMSAAYKYAAFQAFAIPTEGNTDADAESHEVEVKDPLTSLAPKIQAKVRATAAAAIQAFNEGNEWGAYEEAAGLWNQYPEGDERNKVKLAIAHILKPHSALRASLKASAEQERAQQKEAA